MSVKRTLDLLIRDPNNSICADCKINAHPRWASWSHGMFICINCAGIHRSLGTHISKVKSVDLDSWSESNLIALQKFKNNKNANLVYEATISEEEKSLNLTDTVKLKKFIKDKYELKKWYSEDNWDKLEFENLEEKDEPIALKEPPLEDAPITKTKSVTSLRNSIESLNGSLLNLKTVSQSTENLPAFGHIKNCASYGNNIQSHSFVKKSIYNLYRDSTSSS